MLEKLEDFTQVLLNIETYATTYNAALAQISLTYFDIKNCIINDMKVYNIDPESELGSHLFVVDDNTLEWWSQQPQTVQDLLFDNQQPIDKIISNIYNDFGYNIKIWSNTNFDIPIFLNAFKSIEKAYPFKLKNLMDINTIITLANMPEYKKTHDFRIDCPTQVQRICDAYKKIKGEI